MAKHHVESVSIAGVQQTMDGANCTRQGFLLSVDCAPVTALSLHSGEEDHLMADGIAFIDGEYVTSDGAKISVFALGFSRSDVAYDVVSTRLSNCPTA